MMDFLKDFKTGDTGLRRRLSESAAYLLGPMVLLDSAVVAVWVKARTKSVAMLHTARNTDMGSARDVYTRCFMIQAVAKYSMLTFLEPSCIRMFH